MDIRLINIVKQFGDKVILDNCNITFKKHKIHCIMGPSGIGKTTLINILMGLIKPDSGEIHGMEKRLIAAVFQEDRLIEHWDAIRNVKLVCKKNITDDLIAQEFKAVGLEDYRGKPVSKLSGGMRRRVAIVRGIMAESDIVIMDEPFKGLDKTLKRQVLEYVKNRTRNKTVIIVTHNQEEVDLLGGQLHYLSS